MRANIGVIAIACCLLLSSCGNESQPGASSQEGEQQGYVQFSRWGLSFEYPREWREHPPDRVAAMKEYVQSELRTYGRSLLELAFLVGPNDETAILVSKTATTMPMTPSEFIQERNQVYADAQRSGDVTRVNLVRETTVANLPAVEEDVERSNGGRGRTFKMIDGTVVFEVSFIANDASQFAQYSQILDHLVSSMAVEGASEGPDDAGSQE